MNNRECRIFDIRDKGKGKLSITRPSTLVNQLQLPLQMTWNPKEDITAYELARCLPYLLVTQVMPYMIDKTQSHFRHFEITDPNEK